MPDQTVATRLTGAQAFVQCLREEGVEYVFHVPGGQTLSILDALFDAPEIRVVTARHECAAACMADAYGRLTGRAAVVMGTTGPGATNLVTGVGNAHRDSIPVIVVTVNNNRREIGHDEAQDADHVTLMRQFTKSTRFVPEPANVVPAAREAFRIALSGNPGPAHIDFARDAVETGELAADPRTPGQNRPLSRPVAVAADLDAAAALLARAERPVIWAGRGVIGADATAELVALAEAMGAPVITTYNGISAFPGRHDLSLGARSKWGGRPANAALAEADVVLAVGNSLNSISTSRWTLKLPDLVQIDCDPTSIGKRYKVAAAVLGDARDAMARLTQALQGQAQPREQRAVWMRKLADLRAQWRAAVFSGVGADSSPVRPLFVMQTMAEVFDDNTILVYDAGNAGIWAQTVPVQRPRHYMKPVGFGAMAFALPAAIASKITRPDATVVCVIGDGSMAMSLGEIETAVREQAPVIVLVFNDRAFGNIKQLQVKQYGQRHLGVDVGDLRFADIAKAMGADGERVTSGTQLADALRRAIASGVPYVVDVLIDPADSIWNDPF